MRSLPARACPRPRARSPPRLPCTAHFAHATAQPAQPAAPAPRLPHARPTLLPPCLTRSTVHYVVLPLTHAYVLSVVGGRKKKGGGREEEAGRGRCGGEERGSHGRSGAGGCRGGGSSG